MEEVRNTLLRYIGNIANELKYDFLYETNDLNITHCHIVKRDYEGTIIGTPLVFTISISEKLQNGDIVYFNSKGEFNRHHIDLLKDENCLMNILNFIYNRLSFDKKI